MSASVRRLPTAAPSSPARQLGLAAHVLRALADAQADARRIDLEMLCELLGVDDTAPAHEGVRAKTMRREDVRAAVSRLDAEGFVDAARMRLTFAGFALGTALLPRKVMPLRLVKG